MKNPHLMDRIGLWASLGVLAIGPFFPSAASAQVVVGRVVDVQSSEPIPGAAIQMLYGEDTLLGAGLSDGEGRFRLDVDIGGGPFRLEVYTLSYRRIDVDSMFVLKGETLDLGDITLEPSPITLDELPVVVERRRRSGRTVGQEWIRRNQMLGRGTFMSGAEIEVAAPRSLTEYVAERSELWLSYDRWGRPRFTAAPGSRARCVEVFVNRVPFNGFDLHTIDNFPLEHIAAIEIYEDYRDLPEAYAFDTNQPFCGLVNVWTWAGWR